MGHYFFDRGFNAEGPDLEWSTGYEKKSWYYYITMYIAYIIYIYIYIYNVYIYYVYKYISIQVWPLEEKNIVCRGLLYAQLEAWYTY